MPPPQKQISESLGVALRTLGNSGFVAADA
jgi:hypothetical protein